MHKEVMLIRKIVHNYTCIDTCYACIDKYRQLLKILRAITR